MLREECVRHAGGVSRDAPAERPEQRDHLLCDMTEAVDAHAPAEKALRDRAHPVFPPAVPVHCDRPVRGPAHGHQREQQSAFGHGAADRVSPVGHEQTAFKEGARHEFAHAAGEVSDVAQAVGRTDLEIFRQGRESPGAEQHVGTVLAQLGDERCGVGAVPADDDLPHRHGVQARLHFGREKVGFLRLAQRDENRCLPRGSRTRSPVVRDDSRACFVVGERRFQSHSDVSQRSISLTVLLPQFRS